MIAAWQLIWIVPAAAMVGFVWAALLTVTASATRTAEEGE